MIYYPPNGKKEQQIVSRHNLVECFPFRSVLLGDICTSRTGRGEREWSGSWWLFTPHCPVPFATERGRTGGLHCASISSTSISNTQTNLDSATVRYTRVSCNPQNLREHKAPSNGRGANLASVKDPKHFYSCNLGP